MGWYTDKFAASHGKRIIFEKSANYFDNANAPRLMHSLLSDIHLIVILLDPVDRAYSWYQAGFIWQYNLWNLNVKIAKKFYERDL